MERLALRAPTACLDDAALYVLPASRFQPLALLHDTYDANDRYGANDAYDANDTYDTGDGSDGCDGSDIDLTLMHSH